MESTQSQNSGGNNNRYTIIFMIGLCLICGIVLALLATGLKAQQDAAQDLDRNKQLLIAVRIYHPDGYFLIEKTKNQFVPAKLDANTNTLVEATIEDKATANQIAKVSSMRIKPILVSNSGETRSFEEAKIDMNEYLLANKKTGFANLSLKLLYAVYPNTSNFSNSLVPEAYIIPINGRGLWDAIYGYLAIRNDGNHVIGTSWYKHAETPGLGANITLASWQAQFLDKVIFQPDSSGNTDFNTAPIGITVVKGKASEVYGSNPKGHAAVDGIAGSTLTGNGVAQAYKDSLNPYKQFFLRLHKANAGG